MIKTTQRTIVVLVMLLFIGFNAYSQYTGGFADGGDTKLLNLNICANNPPQFYAYFGGNGDGGHTDMVTYIACNNPPQFYAYFGGAADGSSSIQLTTCSNLPPLANFSVSTNTICAGTSVTYTDISTNGVTTWSWVFASGTPSTSSVQNPSVTYNTTGTFNTTLTATNFNGTNTIVKTNYIVVTAQPTLSVNSGSICSGQSFTLNPSGANTYTYSSGSAVVTPTTTSSYTVTGTNIAGCTSGIVSNVSVSLSPTISVVSSSNIICAGTSVSLTASGASSYTWSTGAHTSSIVITPTTTLIYTVSGTNTNGCSSGSSITQSVSLCTSLAKTITENENLIIYPNPTNGILNISSNNLSSGKTEIQLINNLGQIVFKQDITVSNTSLSIQHLPSAMYFVTIIENNKIIQTQKIIKE